MALLQANAIPAERAVRSTLFCLCTSKSEAAVSNNKKNCALYVLANYWQTRSIAQPLCDSRATCCCPNAVWALASGGFRIVSYYLYCWYKFAVRANLWAILTESGTGREPWVRFSTPIFTIRPMWEVPKPQKF